MAASNALPKDANSVLYEGVRDTSGQQFVAKAAGVVTTDAGGVKSAPQVVQVADSAGVHQLAVDASGHIGVNNFPATQPISYVGHAPVLLDSGKNLTFAVTGAGPTLDLSRYRTLFFGAAVTTLTGTAPTLQFIVTGVGAASNWYMYSTPTYTSGGQYPNQAWGAGMNYGFIFPSGFVQWSIGGTSPSATFSYELWGWEY